MRYDEFIQIVHAKIAGRGRYKLQGLAGSESLQLFVEVKLKTQADIHEVSASIITGKILVHFNPQLSHQSIARQIATVVKQAASDLFSKSSHKPNHISKRKSGKKHQVGYGHKKSWHNFDRNTLADVFETSLDRGLTVNTAAQRLEKGEPNIIFQPLPLSKIGLITEQLKSLPVLLLIIEAMAAFLSGHLFSAVLVTGIIVINAIAGGLQEYTTQKTIDSIRRFPHPNAKVLRSGRILDIPGEEIVVGDVLLLEPGTYVGADGRIVEDFQLRIDQSALTGESRPALKSAEAIPGPKPPLLERHNMVYRGTLVVGGTGRAIVVATGKRTVIGRLKRLLQRVAPPKPPVEKQLRQMSDRFIMTATGLCTFTALALLVRGRAWLPTARAVMAMAATAFPTGLLPAAKVNLAVGLRRMRRNQVLIRQLPSLQTLGAVNVICFDKTGTITRSRISVLQVLVGQRLVKINGREFTINSHKIAPLEEPDLVQLLECSVLCNESKIEKTSTTVQYRTRGSPTEKALFSLGIITGIDMQIIYNRYPLQQIDHRPGGQRFMTTIHLCPDGSRMVIMKGDPELILARCKNYLLDKQQALLDPAAITFIERRNEKMAAKGLRVIGFAFKYVSGDAPIDTDHHFTWLGLVGMAEPIRSGVPDMIRQLHQSGIETIMITGDQGLTAYTVGKYIGLSGNHPLEMLDATQLETVSPDLLKALTRKTRIYARLNPTQKLHIVQVLQQDGKTVAMTGDGINDGPALKAADIGIAMGIGGTATARESADIVLGKDNLTTLVPAVCDGRTVYTNIRKSLNYVLASSLSDTLLMLVGVTTAAGTPLLDYQPPHLNFIADFLPGLALAGEPPEHDALSNEPTEYQKPIIGPAENNKILRGAASISVGALMSYGIGMLRYGAGPEAAAMAFHTQYLGKLLHAVACRNTKKQFMTESAARPNHFFNLALSGSILLNGLTIFVPGLRGMAGLRHLQVWDAAVIGSSTLISYHLKDIFRQFKRITP
jgi:Ca2+-transporting ATPase